MSDETQKWTIPNGHAIASSATDKLPAVSGMGVAVEDAKSTLSQPDVAGMMAGALKSIADNTCCGNYQEAALVAKKALTVYEQTKSGWMPIETAPKDEYVRIKNAYFEADGFYDSRDKKWFFVRTGTDLYIEITPQPTHWLIQPPTSETENE